MSVFAWTPDFGATKGSKPSVAKIQFGDGYEARQATGLNSNLKTWNLTFRNRSVEEMDAIEAFLDARAAVESFDWTPPRATTASKFVCRSWSRSIDYAEIDSLTAVFEEIKEP